MALMKCPECDRQVSEKAHACPGCGCPVAAQVQEAQLPTTKTVFDVPREWLHDPNERVIAVMGQGYLTSLVQGHATSCVLILTNKRVYSRGKIYVRTSTGGFESYSGNQTVDVRDVTGTSFFQRNATFFLLVGWIAVLGLPLSLVGAISTKMPIASIFYGTTALSAILTMLFIPVYFILKRKLFLIDYAGGTIACETRWYSEKEMHDFAASIARLKDAQRA